MDLCICVTILNYLHLCAFVNKLRSGKGCLFDYFETMSFPMRFDTETEGEPFQAGQNCTSPALFEELPSSTSSEEILAEIRKMTEKQDRMERSVHSLEQAGRKNTILMEKQMKMISSLTGQKENICEVEQAIPITSIADLLKFEDRLATDGDFKILVERYLRRSKGDLKYLFRTLISDSVMIEFNWDGRAEKRPLSTIALFSRLLFDCCASTMTKPDYIKEIRRQVELSHNRHSKSKVKRGGSFALPSN